VGGAARLDEARALGEPVAHLAVQHLIEEVLLGLAGEIDGALGDAGLAGDVLDRGLLEPEAGEGFGGRDEDALLLVAIHRGKLLLGARRRPAVTNDRIGISVRASRQASCVVRRSIGGTAQAVGAGSGSGAGAGRRSARPRMRSTKCCA